MYLTFFITSRAKNKGEDNDKLRNLHVNSCKYPSFIGFYQNFQKLIFKDCYHNVSGKDLFFLKEGLFLRFIAKGFGTIKRVKNALY